jgi:hypothetical protein
VNPENILSCFRRIVLSCEAEEGTRRGTRWGGEGNEVEVPSSIPFHFVNWAPFFSRFAGEDSREKLFHQFRMNQIAQRARGDGAEGITG